MSELGYTRYMFIDGDLPGNGDDPSLPGHEAMMITNRNAQDAHILVNLYFEDKPPVKGPHLTVPAERVICTRMDLPICEEQYQIHFGQYSVELESDIPVCASYGRLDRRFNLGYYSTGYCAALHSVFRAEAGKGGRVYPPACGAVARAAGADLVLQHPSLLHLHSRQYTLYLFRVYRRGL